MLAALNVPDETMPLASLYLRVFLLSMPSILLYNFEAAIFRSVGITRMPLQALAVSTVLNIGLDLIFVPVLHWGVAGVAIATAIAYTVSAATLFVHLLKTDSVVRVTPRDLGLDPVALKRIVKIGLPAGIQSAVFAVANIIIQSAINSLGTEVMAASSAAMSLEYVCYNLLNSFSQACTTFVGQNHGARQIDRCTKTLKVCLVEGGIVALTTIVIIVGLGREILALFNSDPNIVSIGYIRVCSIFPAYALACFTKTCPATCAALASRSCPPHHHDLRLRHSLLLGILRVPALPYLCEHHDGLPHQPGHHGILYGRGGIALPPGTHLSHRPSQSDSPLNTAPNVTPVIN